ncbi:hypothetical protein BDM02DRAFT_3107833 [Thelephora ganbajun]|uniref:Uncharacterized protein n=1 Tax=Thelephora ganbajun TaxID=370292 RepID=A0ACB6ZUH9_THEGA|nr:hypothetical protein BDM02DRAFT_3107833 [Thelephora ganbajun]
MADLDSCFHVRVWRSIYTTCHRIHRIMCNATEMWWKIDCARDRAAHLSFLRSKGGPRAIVSELRPLNEQQIYRIETMLNHWKGMCQGFGGHRLHTLEFSGSQSSFGYFSWILERPLPRMEHLKINVTDAINEEDEFALPNPVTLKLPMDVPLRTLDLRNVTLSWSSQFHLFNGLRELHLNFRDCDPVVTIPEDELFGIFDASPQLECLSLLRVGHEVPVKNGRLLPPERILQLPNLTSLRLDNDPMVIKHTLAYMDLPVIASLEIRSFISWDMVQILNDLLFPDDRLPARLFPRPPIFAVQATGTEGSGASIEIGIGSINLRFDFPLGQGERGRNVVMSCIPRLVPPSVTSIELDYTKLDEGGWRDFFASHTEIRSIECTEFCGRSVSRSLWDALSPTGEEDTSILCPMLESILIMSYAEGVQFTSLSCCLRRRQTTGFKLRRLKIMDCHGFLTSVDEFNEEFGPLVETVEAGKPSKFAQRWGRNHSIGWEMHEI